MAPTEGRFAIPERRLTCIGLTKTVLSVNLQDNTGMRAPNYICNGSGELVIGVADCNIRFIITT